MLCLRRTICLAALLIAVLPSAVNATGSHGNTKPHSPTHAASLHSSNSATSNSSANSASLSSSKSQSASASNAQQTLSNANSAKATGGNSNSNATGGNASIGSNSTTQTNAGVQDVSVSGDTYEAARIPVATAIAGGTNTTAACYYGVGAGGQGSALGLSIGFGRKDRDCERFALAQFLYDRGNDAAADRLMCQIRAMREALGEDCLALVHQIQLVRPDPRELKRLDFERNVNK